MRWVLIYLMFLLSHFPLLFGQSRITGKIIDKDTKKPLAFASVNLKSNGIGTSTDETGRFNLFNQTSTQTDTLFISFLGYSTLYLPLNKFTNGGVIKLSQKQLALHEIIVTPNAVKSYIRKAYSLIPQNYPAIPLNLTAHFKETIKENDSVIQEVELILGIYKQPSNKKSIDQLTILKPINKENHAKSDLWNYLYFIDGPYEMIYADFAKYRYNFIKVPKIDINFLDERHFKYYDYELIDDTVTFIRFFPSGQSKKGVYEGKVGIDKRNFAFTSLSYSYSKNRLKRIQDAYSKTEEALRINDVYIGELSYNLDVRYTNYYKWWLLNIVNQKYSFSFQNGRENPKSIIEVNDEFKIINIDSIQVKPVSVFKRLVKGIPLPDQIRNIDKEFWKNNNKQ
jgi:hypothetical protein